jgi:Bacteriophage tail sheath protein
MPSALTYPGVYIEEIPSGVRTITGVATSITAFLGRALRGPIDDPVRIHSFADFQRTFGGLWFESTLGYAVQQYFLNGGNDALIVRVHKNAAKATITLPAGAATLTLEATNEGAWGNLLRATVDHDTANAADTNLFNLLIEEVNRSVPPKPVAAETFRNVSRDSASPRFLTRVLEQGSSLVRVSGAVPGQRPDAAVPPAPVASNADGDDGDPPTFLEYEGDSDLKTGLYALEKADLFNLLCIPPFQREVNVALTTWQKALAYCKQRRAMLLVDSPSGWTTKAAVLNSGTGLTTLSSLEDENAALYFPRIKAADPLRENRLEAFAPCGAVAGVFARTDSQRGVWKAPAGLDAKLTGAQELTVKLTDLEQGDLNPLGINCLRTFPAGGNVVWGARTLRGSDRLASDWKYVPVRRLALFLEESLYRGTQWVVFEPNDEPLWSQIRLNVGAFMHNLFRQGAFKGQSPREAYLVKCDKETTTQNDIDLGIVNIVVGFAPLKPAEFVILKIQQLAGQIQT